MIFQQFRLGFLSLAAGMASAILATAGFADETNEVSPPSKLLPLTFTVEQMKGGKTKFLASCAVCHGANLAGGFGPALRGSVFTDRWFPGAVSPLFFFIKTNMPQTAPGTLSNDEVAALIAFIASQNGKAPSGAPLPSDPLALTEIGFDQPTVSASVE